MLPPRRPCPLARVPLSLPALRGARVAVGAVVIAGAALMACHAPVPEPARVQPRLVLLYATCTLNKSFLSPYNSAVPFTPHLAGFARQARVFQRHQSEAGQSGTAFASIFTGTQAAGHGIFRHPTPLSSDALLIGEAFQQAGWEVAAWLDHGMASGELGYAQGADPVINAKLTAEDVHLQAVLERLRRDPQAKALLITNFTVTHGPYQPAPVENFCRLYPEQCDARRDRAEFDRFVDFYHRAHAFLSYDFPATRKRTGMEAGHVADLARSVELLYRANVFHLDQLFGDLLGAIRQAGLWNESVIAMTADHGETLFRQGTSFKWTHGHQLAPEVLEVPLLIHAPGAEAGAWQPVTRSIDVFPTLAGLAGVPLKAPLWREANSDSGPGERGMDLSAALLGRAEPPRLKAWSHTSLIAEPVLEASRKWSLFHSLLPRIDPELIWVQLRDEDRVWQLRRSPEGEPLARLFDLSSDPGTLNDLFDPSDAEHRSTLAELRSYREELIAAYRQRENPREIDRERQEELLKSLSYMD